MFTYNKIISSFFISLFCINILLMVIPIQKEGFLDSNEFGAELLRGVGLIGRKQEVYHTVPVLSNPDKYQSLQKTMDQQKQTDEIPIKDSNLISGDSITNQTQHLFQPSFAISSFGDNKIGIYDSDWDFTDGGSSLSVNLDSSGSNLMAIAILGFNNRNYQTLISSVTFNGDPLTNLGTSEQQDDAHASIWYLKNPDKGSGLTFTLTFNQSVYYEAAAWFAILDGVNLTNTFGPVATYADATTNDSQVTVTSTNGDRVFGAATGETTGPWSVVAPSSELFSYDAGATSTAAANGNATGSSYTLRWTSPVRDHAAAIGVAIHPFIDTFSPVINDFGVDDPGTGVPQFWANVTDEYSPVANVTLKLNGTSYDMSLNGTGYWVYQPSQVDFMDNYDYQISNASDIWGNYLATGSSVPNIIFDSDTVAPDVLQWTYTTGTNTFHANVSDSWGIIDTVFVNVTSHSVTMPDPPTQVLNFYQDFGVNGLGYINDTFIMENGNIDFVITVNDTSGNEFTSTTHSGTVYINTAPVASNVTLSRDDLIQELLPIFSNSTLYLDYNYSDAESQSEAGTEIRWYKDNGTGFILQNNRNDSKSIPVSALVKGDQWYATVTPKDGELFGDPVNSTFITVQNTPPTISSVVVSPASPVTTQQLTVSNTTTDIDGDPITAYQVRWYNPTLNSSYTDFTVIASDQTAKGETWWVELRAYDGTNYSIWTLSNNVTIDNSDPTASTLGITPSSPITHQDLTATYSFFDADGDGDTGSEIRWYRNTILQVALNDLLTVASGLTTKGESWYFTVEPNDGTSFGNLQTSETVTIGNSAPEATDLQITPGSPVTADTLNASYIYTDNDTDADSGTLIRWYKNGVLQGGLNDSNEVSSSYTAKTDEWHFKIRPSDGTDYGSWIS
jgi:hypothetical protein